MKLHGEYSFYNMNVNKLHIFTNFSRNSGNDLPIEASFKEMLSDDLQSCRIILDIVQGWIVRQQIGENVQEKLQRILIQIVDLMEVVNGEVDA